MLVKPTPSVIVCFGVVDSPSHAPQSKSPSVLKFTGVEPAAPWVLWDKETEMLAEPPPGALSVYCAVYVASATAATTIGHEVKVLVAVFAPTGGVATSPSLTVCVVCAPSTFTKVIT